MTMAHVVIREAEFFRSEQESTRTGWKMPANELGSNFQALERMLQVTVADGGSSNDQRTVRNRFGHGLVFFGGRQHGCGADGRTSIAKGHVVWIYHPQMLKSEVAHGSSGRADVERIARVHQDDAQMIEFGWYRQAVCILRQLRGRGLRLT